MRDAFASVRPWITFAGCVLVVAVLYWAQAILIPLALALLITFVLAPLVARLQSWMGRVPAVLVVVVLLFTGLGGIGWALANQVAHLAADLPGYRDNIREKIADVRAASRGGSVEKVQETLKDIQTEVVRTEERKGTPAQPVIVRSEQVATLWGFPDWLSPLFGPLSTAGFVAVMVIFMLLEREDLRGRVIGLIGHGHLAVTTKAFEEASRRVSRQLLMQALVNTIYGACVGAALAFIGVPYPLFWAALGAALRFIPYVGPIIAAGGPLLVALAALPGWRQPLEVVIVLVVLELFTNLVLETMLYAGAAGVSQVALLVAVAFWTWLWGPMGLLMATPLTVCVVVLGKHVPGLYFLSTLMADAPALSPEFRYYQRLLARDQSEAAELVDRYVVDQGFDRVFDGLLLPAVSYAEYDRGRDRLSDEDEAAVVEATRDLLSDLGSRPRGPAAAARDAASALAQEPSGAPPPLRVLAYPVSGAPDAVAVAMLQLLLPGTGITLDVVAAPTLVAEVVALAQRGGYAAVCVAELARSAPSKSRYLVKKLHAALPDVRIVVGRWAPPDLADDGTAALMAAGATHVTSTLIETRDRLSELARVAAAVAPVRATA
ncbi:MAG: AI-2E family transporter [Acidobacteria bacterium]|nr:AI-2E family transporter [Acidobacteriota bacterium]